MGTLYIFIAAVLYSIGGLCIKMIPWGGMAINGARTAVALLVIVPFILVTGHKVRFNRWIFLGMLCITGTNTLFAVANKMTTAANAIVLQFTAPIFVLIFTVVFFKKALKKLDLITCAAVFIGILFFFVDSLQMGGGMGNLIALLSGVAYAGVFMLNDMPDGDSISCLLWGNVFSAVVGLPYVMQETVFNMEIFFWVAILGLFQVGVAYVLLCIGLRTTPPVTASLISGIEPVLNPILVAVFYHEVMGQFAMIGASIVVIAVLAYNVILARTQQIDEQISITE